MTTSESQQRRLERLATMPDAAIDTSDIPEVLDWSDGIRGGLGTGAGRAVLVRLDPAVAAWFHEHGKTGKAFQAEINRVLRQYVAEQAA